MKTTPPLFNKQKLVLACCAALSATGHSTVFAQEETSEKELEVISVVGHKITEFEQQNDGGALGKRAIKDTPFSVDVISLEDMEIRQVNTLNSLFSREASVSVDGSAYSSFGDTIRVRGLPLDYTQSFKVNGMSINSFSGELPYEAFEQVTLIKGATGFMYGMAAPGGIVNYVTKRATSDALSANVGWRSDSVFSGHIDASTRFGSEDAYGLRVNLVKEDGDTYLDDGGIDRETASIALDAALTDNVLWTVDVIYSDRLVENSWNRFTVSMDSAEPLPDTVDGSRNLAVPGTYDGYTNMIAITGLEWNIDDNWQLKLDYDYSKNETSWIKSLNYLLNSDGDLSILTYEQYFDVDYDQIQGVLTGSFTTGGLQHNIVAGAAFQEATTYRNDGGEYGRIVTRNYATNNLYEQADVPTYVPTLQKDLALAWVDTQRSVFISDFIALNNEWELLVGIRSNEIEHEVSEYFSSSQDDYEDTAVSPTYALMYKPSASTTYYASYVESFEGQTSAVGEEYANANELLEPLESSQYELGVKTSGEGWSLSAAVFEIEQGATLVTEENYLIQEGVTLYQGIEFSGAYEITQNLSIYGDAMFLDAEYDKTTSNQGNDVAGAPDQQFTLQTNYNVEAIPGLTLNLGGKFHGEAALNAANAWEVPSYTLIYGGVSYATQIDNHAVTLIGSVDNLLDEEYWAVGDSYGGGNLRIGEPRTVALKVKVDF